MATISSDGDELVWPSLSSTVEHNYPIGQLTTYRVGGAAQFFVEVATADDLRTIASFAAEQSLPTIVIGLGSNLLIPDSGFDGLALRLGEQFSIATIDDSCVFAGGATSLPRLARQTVAAGLTGFEWAVGVPGSIGGAARMNAGGHGSDMAASVDRVSGVNMATGENFDYDHDAMVFGYRTSSLSAEHCVTNVSLRLSDGDVERGEQELSEIVRWRRENQPGGQNAGSVFVNPEGDSAGRLIDEAGCKGLRIGTAEVSTKHANFIQADPDGNADDILLLMHAVTERVRDFSGVELIAETRILGRNFVSTFDPIFTPGTESAQPGEQQNPMIKRGDRS